MEVEENGNPRLGIRDKRVLFAVLLAKTERLLFLNKFPEDLEDYALSLQEPDIEKAWRLLKDKTTQHTLAPIRTTDVMIDNHQFTLSCYRKEGSPGPHQYRGHDSQNGDAIFMDTREDIGLPLMPINRFYSSITEWGRRQVRLEEQIIRTLQVIKGIVTSCNTVGQYQRVSPELLGFLPDKYKLALRDMVKKSPYPAIDMSQEEIDTAMSTLAYASLQPTHIDEDDFIRRPTTYGGDPTYTLSISPQSSDYLAQKCRRCEL